MTVLLQASTIVRVLTLTMCALVSVHVALQTVRWLGDHQQLLGLLRLFDLDRERNAPTLFSTLLLVGSASLVVVVGARDRVLQLGSGVAWFGLAAILSWIAIDEAWEFHELAIRPLRRALPETAPSALYFAWVMPGAAFVLLVCALYARFVWRLPAETRLGIVVAGAVYVSGALGMELVDGAWAATRGAHNAGYSMLTTIEETLEMTGLVLFLRALLRHLAAQGAQLSLRFAA